MDELRGLAGRLEAMRDFLNGERGLDGTWFGDDPAPGIDGARFWWRKPMHRDLSAAIEALTRPAPSPADAGLVERLRTFQRGIFHARGMSIKPRSPSEVETVQITAREAELVEKALADAAARIEALSGEYARALEDAEREAWRVLSSWPEEKVSAELIEAVQTRIRTLKAGAASEENDHA